MTDQQASRGDPHALPTDAADQALRKQYHLRAYRYLIKGTVSQSAPVPECFLATLLLAILDRLPDPVPLPSTAEEPPRPVGGFISGPALMTALQEAGGKGDGQIDEIDLVQRVFAAGESPARMLEQIGYYLKEFSPSERFVAVMDEHREAITALRLAQQQDVAENEELSWEPRPGWHA